MRRGFNNLTLPNKAKADLVSANKSDASSNHNENSFVAFRRHRFKVLTFRAVLPILLPHCTSVCKYLANRVVLA